MSAVDLSGLNPPQREAVEHGDGPLLILAGAGSGKTRVITHRIVRLVDVRKVKPWRILAVTFTNKAAGEMRERTARLLAEASSGAPGEDSTEERARSLWLGTFHSTCARLLRIHAVEAGLKPDFLIFDDDDQKKLVGRIMKDASISDRLATPRAILGAIDKAKNAGIGPERFRGDDFFSDLVAQVYPEYQRRLRAMNGVDFNDLLLDVLRLCEKEGDASKKLLARFDHVLVDEFQDTNSVQYQLVRLLARRTNNLCVVGDDDQSIYRWRGADVRNILDFERDHPGCRTIKLEQNYRSTANILEAANSVIARNLERKQKRLFTENEAGKEILYFTASDERQEARFVVSSVRTLENTEDRAIADFAIFYRTHAQSRAFEDQLRANDLPYTIVGGIRFYDRAEVKDLLAYLRVVANPADEVSLERIVNVPARGIGESTVDKVRQLGRSRGISLWEAMRVASGKRLHAKTVTRAPAVSSGQQSLLPVEDLEVVNPIDDEDSHAHDVLGAGPRRKLAAFVELIDGLRAQYESSPDLGLLANHALDRSGYLQRLTVEDKPEAEERVENLAQLVASLREYQSDASEPSLVGYLEKVSLVASADAKTRGVSLMTVHAAKGLEFPVVFVTGLEEGTFPRAALGTPREELEEERRLAYVAITRARERLVLTNAARRQRYGDAPPSIGTPVLDPLDMLSLRESRFLSDIPESLIARPVSPRRASPPQNPLRAGHARWPVVEPRGDGTVVERDAEHADPTGQYLHGYEQNLLTPVEKRDRDEGSLRVEYDASPEAVGDFRCGQTVTHDKFGQGQVLALSGSGTQLKVTVRFANSGRTLTLVSRFLVPR